MSIELRHEDRIAILTINRPEALNAMSSALLEEFRSELNASSRDENVALLEDLCETMRDASLGALGGFTPFPVLSALRQWPEDFE